MSLLQEIYNSIPWYRKLWFDIKFKFELLAWKIVGEWLEAYVSLFWLHYYGFYPLGVVKSYHFETTFLFDTKREAKIAFKVCEEENRRAIGWYYELNEFKELVDKDKYYNYNDLNIWWVYEN